MKRCSKCGEAKPLPEFSRDAGRRDGLQPWCKKCHKQWRQHDPDRVRAGDHQSSRKYRQRIRQAVFDHYGHACACPGCGAAQRLTIDHVNGDGAAHRREMFGEVHLRGGRSTQFYRWLIEHGFPGGFQVLCLPCNRSKGEGDRCGMHQGG